MARYHLNEKGEPGICRAKRNCPFGDLADEHYSSESKAREAYEIEMQRESHRYSLGLSYVKEIPGALKEYLDLPTEIFRRNAEIDYLARQKSGLVGMRLQTLEDTIRTKENEVAQKVEQLLAQNFSKDQIDSLIDLIDAVGAFLDWQSEENEDYYHGALEKAQNMGIDSNAVNRVAEDAALADLNFRKMHRNSFANVSEEYVSSQRTKYINEVLHSPNLVIQMRQKYEK